MIRIAIRGLHRVRTRLPADGSAQVRALRMANIGHTGYGEIMVHAWPSSATNAVFTNVAEHSACTSAYDYLNHCAAHAA